MYLICDNEEVDCAEYSTMTFANFYPKYDLFRDGDDKTIAYKTCGLPQKLKEEDLKTLYFLMLGKYANSPIKSSDPHRFMLRLWSIIFEYGPIWARKLEMQDKIREMTDDELFKGSQQIYNHSFNPSTPPKNDTYDALDTINEQQISAHKRSKIDAYAYMSDILEQDITRNFLDRFKELFLVMVEPQCAPLYEVDANIYKED